MSAFAKIEAINPNGLDRHINNGALKDRLGKLDTLFLTLDHVGDVGGVPILKRRDPSTVSPEKYSISKRFQDKVIAAGFQGGRELFVSGHPTFGAFYEARESGKAIEFLLTPPAEVDPTEWGKRIGWTEAARSVIERKELGVAVLAAHGEDILAKDSSRKLNLLSIASGWGRLPLDTMRALDSATPGTIEAVFVDTSEEAINESVKEAAVRGLGERVRALRSDFFHFLRTLGSLGSQSKYELVESTGFSDYLKDPLLMRLIRACKDLVVDDGIVIITNITSDRERDYLKIVWEQDRMEMNRRSPEQLASMALTAGFEPKALVLDSTATMCTLVAVPLKDK